MPKLVSNPIQKAVDLGPMHRQQHPSLPSASPRFRAGSDAYLLDLCLSLFFLFFVLEPMFVDEVMLCWLPPTSPTLSGLLANNCLPFTSVDLSLAQSNTCPVFSRIDDDDECEGNDVIVTFICSRGTFFDRLLQRRLLLLLFLNFTPHPSIILLQHPIKGNVGMDRWMGRRLHRREITWSRNSGCYCHSQGVVVNYSKNC